MDERCRGKRKEGDKTVSKHQIHAGRPNLCRGSNSNLIGTCASGSRQNGFCLLPVQLTTRITGINTINADMHDHTEQYSTEPTDAQSANNINMLTIHAYS